ncbi:YcaO-like family protein [Geodermatophilus sp. SYSU D01062]
MTETWYLTPSALVAATPTALQISHRGTRVHMEWDASIDPEDACSALRDEGTKGLGALVGEDPVTLELPLHEAALLTQSPPPDLAVSGTVPLAVALKNLQSNGPPAGFLIYTADEAFMWSGQTTALGKQAFRLFVSKLADLDRCQAYGLLASGSQVSISGDLPDPRSLELAAARRVEFDGAGAVALDLHSGDVSGLASSLQDLWSPDSSRLSVTTVTQVQQFDVQRGRPLFWVNGYTAFSNLSTVPPIGNGSAPDFDHPRVSGIDEDLRLAHTKCIAEGKERFTGGDVQVSELLFSSADQLPGPWLHPDRAIDYSAAQRRRLGLSRFDPRTPEWWGKGEGAEGTVWLPAALIYYPFTKLPSWLPASAVSSNGMAAYPTLREATRRAWLELVERDAFQRVRITGPTSPPQRVVATSLPRDSHRIVAYLSDRSVTHVMHLPSAAGPAVALVRADDGTAMAIGMAAADDFSTAVAKAGTEALVQLAHPFTHTVSPEEVDNPGDHAALYRTPEWRRRLDWMTTGALADFEDIPESAWDGTVPTTCLRYVFSTPDSGLAVVRAVDPSLIPLTFGYDADPTGHSPFAELLQRAGHDSEEPLDPHPFA